MDRDAAVNVVVNRLSLSEKQAQKVRFYSRIASA
jgi:hypothetical protein